VGLNALYYAPCSSGLHKLVVVAHEKKVSVSAWNLIIYFLGFFLELGCVCLLNEQFIRIHIS
jgi:hypothetical protein